MELSSRTIDILKNFSAINPNLVITEGNQLKTVAVAKNVFATATIDETFPRCIGVYDLNEFLSVLGLVKNPNLMFTDNHFVISDNAGLSSVKYWYSDPEMLTSPAKDIKMPDVQVKFDLSTDTLASVKRAAAALGHNEISIRPSGKDIEISVTDTKDATSNSFSCLVSGEFEEGVDFNFVLNVANLKLINEDFQVSFSTRLISNFKSYQSPIEYFIALEKSSTYGA